MILFDLKIQTQTMASITHAVFSMGPSSYVRIKKWQLTQRVQIKWGERDSLQSRRLASAVSLHV